MEVRHIDHVNLRIPADSVDEAIEFYEEHLGFPTESLQEYRNGSRSIFSFRLGPTSVLHVQPSDDFEAPTGTSFRHVALVVEEPIERITERFENAGIHIQRDGTPLGATGRGSAVYINDPFGYRLEFKETQDT